MSRISAIPGVEALSESAWRNIESRVFVRLTEDDVPAAEPPVQPIDRAYPRRRLLALGAAGAAVALVSWFALSGRGERAQRGPEFTLVRAGDSFTTLSIAGSSIEVAPRSSLWYRIHDRGLQIILERGEVECSVAPQPAGSVFAVNAADVRVEVVGTRFSVERWDQEVFVDVTRGLVAVVHDSARYSVSAGQTWSNQDLGAASMQGLLGPARKALLYNAMELEDEDIDAAMLWYRKLSYGTDEYAAAALYGHARLRAQRGQKDRARTLVEQYLTRFPNGANRADARVLHARMNGAQPPREGQM